MSDLAILFNAVGGTVATVLSVLYFVADRTIRAQRTHINLLREDVQVADKLVNAERALTDSYKDRVARLEAQLSNEKLTTQLARRGKILRWADCGQTLRATVCHIGHFDIWRNGDGQWIWAFFTIASRDPIYLSYSGRNESEAKLHCEMYAWALASDIDSSFTHEIQA